MPALLCVGTEKLMMTTTTTTTPFGTLQQLLHP